jgi:cytosine/adenosine deaminase-related metal-dependent hydrolase
MTSRHGRVGKVRDFSPVGMPGSLYIPTPVDPHQHQFWDYHVRNLSIDMGDLVETSVCLSV